MNKILKKRKTKKWGKYKYPRFYSLLQRSNFWN